MNNNNTSEFSNAPANRAHRLPSLLWAIALTATISAVITVIAFFPARAHSSQTTQTFRPGRFALEMAEVNVKMQMPHRENTLKMLFKVDSVTGEVWALQVATFSFINPQITSANWVKVQSAAPFQPGQNNMFQQF